MVVAVAILTTLAAGLPVTLALDRRARGPVLVGLSFLYGAALVWATLLAIAITGLRWSTTNEMVTLLLVSSVCFTWWRMRGPAPESSPFPPARLHVGDAVTLVVVAGHAFYATVANVWEWDFWAIWGLKARVFLGSGTIDWQYLERPWNEFVHPDYPVLLPLNYVFAGLLGEGWSDRWLGLYAVAFGVALLLVIRHLAQEEIRPVAASILTLAATAFALSGFVGLAEGPLIAYGTAGILFVRRYQRTGDAADARHAALLLGLAAMCKNEGLSLVVAAAIALLFTERRVLPRLWPALAVIVPWFAVKAFHHLPGDLTQGSVAERVAGRLSHPAAFLAPFARELPDVWVWALVAAAFALGARRLVRDERFTLLTLLTQLVFFGGVYLATPYDLTWHVATSWPRLARQLAAPLLYVVMIMLARTFAGDDDLAHAEARSER